MKPKSRIPAPTLTKGQVWQMDDETTCNIGDVGKRLVHHKMFRGTPVRKSPTLGNLEILAKHLKTKKAVLVQAYRWAGRKLSSGGQNRPGRGR